MDSTCIQSPTAVFQAWTTWSPLGCNQGDSSVPFSLSDAKKTHSNLFCRLDARCGIAARSRDSATCALFGILSLGLSSDVLVDCFGTRRTDLVLSRTFFLVVPVVRQSWRVSGTGRLSSCAFLLSVAEQTLTLVTLRAFNDFVSLGRRRTERCTGS